MARKFNSENFEDDQPFERKPRTISRPKRRNDDESPRNARPRRTFNDGEKPFRPKRRDFEGGEGPARPRRSSSKFNDRPSRDKRGFGGDESRPRRRFNDDNGDHPRRDNRQHRDGDRPRRERVFNRDRNNRFEDKRPRRRNVTAESDILSEIVSKRIQEGRQTPRKQRILSLEYEEQHGPMRLNKYIANAGICSRREADVLIASGAITVNGEVVTEMGHKVLPTDEVRYGDKVLQREKPVYVLLNKPKDYITTTDDERDRANVMELVRDACEERIYPVGRLDRDTTGLLLFTNDGDLTKKLTHPSTEIEKTYWVELDKPFASIDMAALRNGVELSDGVITPDDVQYVEGADSKKEVGVTIHSGKNRIIRRMFEYLGYEVVKLDRVIFAGLTKKDLPRGMWRFLTKNEVNFLKMTANKKE